MSTVTELGKKTQDTLKEMVKQKEFKFEVAKETKPNSKGEVTISLTKESGFMAQCANPEETKRVLTEVGEYQKQLTTWGGDKSISRLNAEKAFNKVKVKSPYTSKNDRVLGVDVVAVRSRQMGPDHKGPYIGSEIKSDLLSSKEFHKGIREKMTKELK